MTGKQKRYLKSLAHPLKAVVQIGKLGFNSGAQRHIDQQLLDHELIKVRILESCPMDRRQFAVEIEKTGTMEVVQIIGKILTLYRPHPKKPSIQLPD